MNHVRQKILQIKEAEWTMENVKLLLNDVAEEQGLDFVQVMKNLRFGVTGTKVRMYCCASI